eukprot:COSAG02_NODE_10442_length_1940_cov_1.389462_1_plen_425_part_00
MSSGPVDRLRCPVAAALLLLGALPPCVFSLSTSPAATKPHEYQRRVDAGTGAFFHVDRKDALAQPLGTCEWPANASHIQCDMDLGHVPLRLSLFPGQTCVLTSLIGRSRHYAAAGTPAACVSACCSDPKCAAWQWGNASCGASAGCGCWLGHRNVDGAPTGCRDNDAWIGGSRIPPHNAPPPSPPTNPSTHSGVPPEAALLWPKPQHHIIGGTLLRVDADAFLFSTGASFDTTMHVSSSKHPAGILTGAFERYRAICFPPTSVIAPHTAPGLPVLSGLEVVVASADETLSMGTSEKYSLTIPHAGGNATLTADTIYGALRGLETFSQMLQPDLTILEQSVDDWPRFPFRAVLIDTGRHFLPVSLIEAHIDAMAYNKMNVLHWVCVHTGHLLSSLVHTPHFFIFSEQMCCYCAAYCRHPLVSVCV